jgi:hypothetical protein
MTHVLVNHLELLQPTDEGVSCSVGCFLAVRAFDRMEDLVALVDSRPRLLLARKTCGVIEIADDTSVPQTQLRREIEFHCHAAATMRRRNRFQT